MIKLLILLKIQNMVDVNCRLCKCFDKKSATHADKSAINTSGGAIKANY